MLTVPLCRVQFRLIRLPLYTTRPFVIEDVTLSDEVNAKEANPASAVEEVLTARVNDVIDRIRGEAKFSNPDRPALPLVRLRVEHTGFARPNAAKFGQKFVGKVANPDELLLFYKQKVATSRVRGGKGGGGGQLDLSSLHREVDEAPPISEIVAKLIAMSPLTVLSEGGLAGAIEEFVEKKTIDSIAEFVKRDLKGIAQEMKRAKEVVDKGGA